MAIKGHHHIHEEKSSEKESIDNRFVRLGDYTGKELQNEANISIGNGSQILDSSEDEIETAPTNLMDLEGTDQLQMAILILLFLEKFVEIAVVFLSTLVVILWESIYHFVLLIFWPLIGFVVVSAIALTILYRLRWCRRSPGFLVFKLIYILFLTSLFIVLAIHVPVELTFLYPYYALVAAGTIEITYIFFMILTLTHKHLCKVHAKGCSIMALTVAVPLAIILVNQPVYLYGGLSHTHDYWDFMVNITIGVITSLPFSYETVYIYREFVNSTDLDNFINTPGLIPGFVTVYYSKDQVTSGKFEVRWTCGKKALDTIWN